MSEWLAGRGYEQGAVVSAQTMYELSIDWYAARMDFDWIPPTPEEAMAIFAKHGLSDEFWALTSY